MVSLLTLLNKLLPNASNSTTELLTTTNEIRKNINHKLNELYNTTVFEFNNENLNQLLSCFLLVDYKTLPLNNKTNLNRYFYNKCDLDDYRNKLIKILDDDSIFLEDSYVFNRKKLISLITTNNHNNELLLFLAYYYNVNIIIYFDDINIFKMYYPETKYDSKKNCILLKYLEDYYTNIYSYQLLYDNNNYVISSDNFIIKNIELIYPIGFEENKQFKICDQDYILKDDNLLDLSDSEIIDEEICQSVNNIPINYHNDYIKYILKNYKFKDYKLFKYYK